MKLAHETLSLGELAAVLRTLCQERRTGTMFLSTDTNHSARIGIERGRIFSVAFGRYRGVEAIEQIKQIQHGKFSFAESIFNNAAEVPLPPTSELLMQIDRAASGDQFWGEPAASAGAWDAPSSPMPVTERAAKPVPILTGFQPADLDDRDETLRVTGNRLYDAIAEALALSIGPVASVVCDDYREQLLAVSSPSGFRTLASQIAAEIGDDAEGARFLARAVTSAGLPR